jgi:lipopolysaccharide/colanic/teichoic acid biosynthesis glycosyltransferase
MYKLRTMHVGAAAGGPITAAADARMFRVGRILRRVKLDEVPQLVNVVRGEMGLVGPRPEDIGIVERHYTPMMWETLSVRPGMTSAGSLHYFADEDAMPSDPAEAEAVYLERLLPAKIAVDLQYVRTPTFGYEVQILARTALAVIGLDRVFEPIRRREEAMATQVLREASGQ